MARALQGNASNEQALQSGRRAQAAGRTGVGAGATTRTLGSGDTVDIKGKVIVVTGGASGIGAALVRRFAREGAAGVVVADLDLRQAQPSPPRSAASRCASTSSNEADVQAMIAQATRALRPRRRAVLQRRHRARRRRRREQRRLAAHLGRQPDGPRVRRARRAAADDRARRGLPAADRVGRRAAVAPRLGAVRGDQARRGVAGRVAVDQLRRQGHSRQLPVPAGRAHADAAGQGRRPQELSDRGLGQRRTGGRRRGRCDARRTLSGAAASRGARVHAAQDLRRRPLAGGMRKLRAKAEAIRKGDLED